MSVAALASADDVGPIDALRDYLQVDVAARKDIASEPFGQTALTREQAERASSMLWRDHVVRMRTERAAEMKAKRIEIDDRVMPFYYKLFGEKPEGGRSLYISMHGGGGTPSRVNDQQWENQKRLYQLKEGVYLVPRAPTDTWNLWHQSHIDEMFGRLIENLIVFEDVNPDRVYIMGYSARGDGVYQLAPRMADRLAAAAMMAGHPNETSPLGLRNIGFTLHVGANDGGYDRNKKALEWKDALSKLQKEDPQGYRHHVEIHAGKGHWMDRKDAVALDWMAKFTRDLRPDKIVWKQDDVQHRRFYWLAIDGTAKPRALVTASRSGQTFRVASDDVDEVMIRLDDTMVDFEKPIEVRVGDRTVYEGTATRSIATLSKTLRERGDARGMFSAEVRVTLKR